MLLSEDVQLLIYAQTAWNTVPTGIPEGYLVPRGSNFELTWNRKLITNDQIQSDGVDRAPGFGDATGSGQGDLIANLLWMVYAEYMWAGAKASTAPVAPATLNHHVVTVARNTVMRTLEMGFIPPALFYRLPDHVFSELHFQLATNGICKLGTKLTSSGLALDPVNAAIDTTPTELVAPTVDYNSLVFFENGADLGEIKSMQVDCVSQIGEKRPPSKGGTSNNGVATELRMKKKTVTGKVVFWFESDARWARVRAGTRTNLKYTLIDGDANDAMGEMKEVVLEPTGVKLNDKDGVIQEFVFQSIRYSNLTETPIKWTHNNSVATYPS